MDRKLALTVIAEDKPGLVELLSQTIAAHGGNWEASRMAHLAGRFAGILRVGVSEGQLRALAQSLESLTRDGMRVVVEECEGAEPQSQDGPLLQLELVGADRPGIVQAISRVLAAQSINVEELETSCQQAPMSGGTLFRANARLRAPAGVSLDEVRDKLEEIGQELMVDVAVDEHDEPV